MDPFARLKRAVGLDTTPRKEDYPKWVEATELLEAHKYPEAERLLKETARELRDAGESDTAIGMITADLARAQWRLHHFDQAQETVEAAQELLNGRRASPGLADCLEIQANLIRDKGDPKNAIDLYREALAIQKKLPLDAEKLTQRYRDLGVVLLDVDQEESRQLLEQAIQIARDQRGSRSLLVVRGMLELARYQAFLGEQAEALDTIKQASEIEADDSPSWPTNTEMLESIAVTLVQAHRLDDAVYYYEYALKIAECRIGVDVIHLAGLMTGLADIHRNDGNVSAALELLQQAVAKLQGRSTFHLPTALESLGDCYAQMGRFSEAVKSYNSALDCWLKEPDLYQEQIEENKAILEALRKQLQARSHPAAVKSKTGKKKTSPPTDALGKVQAEPTKSPTTVSAAERAKFKLPKANFRSPAKPKPKPKEKEPTVIPLQIPSDGTVVVTGLAPGASPSGPFGAPVVGGVPPAGGGKPATPPGGYRAGGKLFPSGQTPGGPSGAPAGSSAQPGNPESKTDAKQDANPDTKPEEKKKEENRETTRAERRLRTRRPNPGPSGSPAPPSGPVVVSPGTGFMVSSGSATPSPGVGVPLSQARTPSSGSPSYAQPVNRTGSGANAPVAGGQPGPTPPPNGGSAAPNSRPEGRPGRRGGSAAPGGGQGSNPRTGNPASGSPASGNQGPVFHGIGSTPAGAGSPAGVPGSGSGGAHPNAMPGSGYAGPGQPSASQGGSGNAAPSMPGGSPVPPPSGYPGGPYPASPNPGVYPQSDVTGGGNPNWNVPGNIPGAFSNNFPNNFHGHAGPEGIRFLDPAGQPMHAASASLPSAMQMTVQVPGAKPLPDGTPVTENLQIPFVPPQQLRGWEELEFELLG